MDDLAERNMIIGNLETLLAFNKEVKVSSNQDSLFGSIGGVQVKLSLAHQEEANIKEKLTWEKELLGLYISGHPLNAYKDKIEKFGTLIKKIQTEVKVNTPVTVAAIIEDVRVVTTKKNDRMAFIKLSDFSGTIDAVVFSRLFETIKDILVKDTIVAMKGKVTERNGEKSLMIESLKVI
jgi:DNA polymerase-3 subunit alpha